MLKVKNNFRGNLKDISCKACGLKNETQEHILNECPRIHSNNLSKVSPEDIFSEDPISLKNTAHKINKILESLEDNQVVDA